MECLVKELTVFIKLIQVSLKMSVCIGKMFYRGNDLYHKILKKDRFLILKKSIFSVENIGNDDLLVFIFLKLVENIGFERFYFLVFPYF